MGGRIKFKEEVKCCSGDDYIRFYIDQYCSNLGSRVCKETNEKKVLVLTRIASVLTLRKRHRQDQD